VQTPRITGSFSLASRLGNALALSLQSSRLKLKNLLKQAGELVKKFAQMGNDIYPKSEDDTL
jgi:hypothetical protein